MKVDDFLKPIPGQLTVQEVIAEIEEPEHVTSLTPSGIEVYYQWSPRLYKVRQTHNLWNEKVFQGGELPPTDWQEVPSVTTVLNVLDKSGALTWWGMRVGITGVVELWKRGVMPDTTAPGDYTLAELEKLVIENKLSTNHVKDEASGRGVNVHSAFEKWSADPSYRPDPNVYPENERGYVAGLVAFFDDLGDDVSEIEAEVMVGSIEHGFAGRYDTRLTLERPTEMVVKTYPVKKDKKAEIPAGKYLLDLKTSKGVYPTHALQLAAYELASVECGYGPTDHRAVVHVTADGKYELVLTHAGSDDFLSVLAAHNTMQSAKGWT